VALKALDYFQRKYPFPGRFWFAVRYIRSIGRLDTVLETMHLLRRGERPPATRVRHLELLSNAGLITYYGKLSSLGEEILRYFEERERQVRTLLSHLRTVEEARSDLIRRGIPFQEKRTKSGVSFDFVRSEVEYIARRLFGESCYTKDAYIRIPQLSFVSIRKIDVSIPGPVNPKVVMEIKEYWGEKRGGSKMSNAIYETYAVARELKDLEKEGIKIWHFVVFDGKKQWETRVSDLGRFVDLLNAGLIDGLFAGREIWTEFKETLEELSKTAT